MSTSFDVYPTIDVNPTFRSVIHRSQELIQDYLASFHIHRKVRLEICLSDQETQSDINQDEAFQIPSDQFLVVTLSGTPGGFYVYFMQADEIDHLTWKDEFDREQAKCCESEIRHSLSKGYYWDVTRYAGTDPILNIAYGFFASALAELTNAYLYSSDNAWDYDLFPCTPEAFNEHYFRPDRTQDKELQEWAKSNLTYLSK